MAKVSVAVKLALRRGRCGGVDRPVRPACVTSCSARSPPTAGATPRRPCRPASRRPRWSRRCRIPTRSTRTRRSPRISSSSSSCRRAPATATSGRRGARPPPIPGSRRRASASSIRPTRTGRPRCRWTGCASGSRAIATASGAARSGGRRAPAAPPPWDPPAPVAELASGSVDFAPAVDATETTHVPQLRPRECGRDGRRRRLRHLHASTRTGTGAAWGWPAAVAGRRTATTTNTIRSSRRAGWSCSSRRCVRGWATSTGRRAASLAEPFAPPVAARRSQLDRVRLGLDAVARPRLP